MIKSVLLTAMLICTGMISDNDASIAQDSIRSSIYGPFFSNSTLNKNLTYYLVQQYEESISELQRPVTSDFLEEPRRQVIGEIARQGNLGIAINPDLPLLDVPLTIKLENNTVAEALKLSLAGTNYEAAISRWREIVLVEREEALPGSDLYQQHAIITGRIVDASSGEPLIGANIILQNTAVGTTSNMDGEYSLRGIPAGEQVLEIRYLGYVPLNIPINMIEGEERYPCRQLHT